MTNKEYIESGILELYVAGTLSESENEAVFNKLIENPDILDEIIKIETAVIKLTAAVSPSDSKHILAAVKAHLGVDNTESRVIPLQPKSKTNWFAYTGWAASIVLAGGLIWLLNQHSDLQSDIKTVETELQKRDIDNALLENQIETAKANLADAEKLVSVLRDRNILNVPLDGQAAFPEAYANVYWDKNNSTIYLDVQALPTPPRGKVYQVWSLTLNPLTPTSLGTLNDFNTDTNKIFAIPNTNASQAFGITLEPEGGSETPTMEQLYSLGVVASTP